VEAETDLVIHVAGLRRIKDQATLLRAWQLVLDSRRLHGGRKALLLIAGEGPCQEDLENLARELDIVDGIRFLGQRRDLDTLLPACDLFVLSSLSEGLSFAVLEAMASGLPVVATQVGGNGELIEEGRNGHLVPAQDPKSLGKALGRLLEDPILRKEMGKRGREIAERRYDAGKAAERYVALYQRLIDSRLRKRVDLRHIA
jgi:glycosyltransferase involved in cell wall biosynthesis